VKLAIAGPSPALTAWRRRGDLQARNPLWRAAAWDLAGLLAACDEDDRRAVECVRRAAKVLRDAGYEVVFSPVVAGEVGGLNDGWRCCRRGAWR